MTTVGKIFKPALIRETIERTCYRELDSLKKFLKSIEVQAVEDLKNGTMVYIYVNHLYNISAEKIRNKMDDILGQYLFKYKIIITN